MPLYKSIAVNPSTNVKIWKIDEPYDELIKPLELTPNSHERVLGMKSSIHQRGFLSVRHLLREFGYSDKDLYYNSDGKPHLRDKKHISITHSFTFSAVIVSNNEVGIDIEKQREKIKIVAEKFIGYEEQYLTEEDPDLVKKLTIIWCAKESLFKIYEPAGLSFKMNTLVIPFMLEHESTNAWIDHEGTKLKYNIDFLEFEGFSCAYAT
ncbi:MAG: 4'-phosphopantetheinyl transferase superfamily protein [Flavobacteriaceae bacterium]|nr:4'-phosphopantetheinyl transferase superfamily protein [Bacteroidia bacterium]NNK28050.1 4'-phosphopantetheinyl transferase superfamily protein [Flavobacteriaceae bacterium]NNL61972.1 4'-phosphopantetheinyl transferase superfamily protein [Flavobacteriaceae bacterium]RZV61728.1 MAG: 4'-phosphopantetheinyl transferase superfamily protein [Flavobacteriaceae bacterium]